MKDALAAWKKRHPKIETSILEATGPDLLERIRAEQRAGRAVADVVANAVSAATGIRMRSSPFSKCIPNGA